ncbi:hypothetical protein F441_07317 [Phytophthora nicotianae CJ01A1]|uniref:PH domain-containing protein n=1 Tax=Phytophthora nicotianae CJ01A1 TaxID=1317063 RepID=W2X6T1_PHYNI|nr:hypothetical protein F441_07317 [Phytophthora nicotianae CJ01A1]
MLVNGVDISMLEGWMIKINSNPSFFGKNMNRRWFKVGFVPGPGSEKKLVISYSTSKTAKDPRGWLYVEDVSGIYCRREMIEIVSPSRTLRLKGETAVEHRLWSDSLYKLCNPSPKAAPTATIAEPRREHTSHTQRETKQDDDEEEDRAKCKHRSERDREHDQDHDRDRERDRDREHDQDYDRDPVAAVRGMIMTLGNAAPRPQCIADRDVKSGNIRPSEHDVSDDSQEEDEDSPRPSTNSSTRSVLVAQIKSGSGLEDGMAQCKNVMSDSEEEDVNYENKQADPPEESPREPLTSSTDPIDDDFSHEKLEQMIPQRMNLTEPTKHKNSEYFDSDEEEQEQPPSKTNTRLSDNKTPVSNVTADNNFVHDDWDAEEEPTSQPTTKAAYSTALTGGVAADANFVHDDWDD